VAQRAGRGHHALTGLHRQQRELRNDLERKARQMAALKGVAIAARMLLRQCQPTNGGLHRLGKGTLLALAVAIDAAIDEGIEIQDRRLA